MLIIEPRGGLANRMRVIASALKVRQLFGVDVYCIWNVNSELNAEFEDLFENIEGLNIIKKRFKYKCLRSNIHNSWLARAVNKLMGIDIYYNDMDFTESVWFSDKKLDKQFFDKKIYLRTCEQFVETVDYDDFVVKQYLMRQVDELTASFHNTIGVHIRRTDNVDSINNSPLELFVEKMKQEIALDNKVNFFLATDDISVEDDLTHIFGSKIITRKKEISRSSLQGIKDAVVDMYCLARTEKILGSYWSSFSTLASMVGKKEVEIIRK